MNSIPLFEICRPKQWKTISSKELLNDGYPVYGANGKIGFYHKFNHEKPTVLITCRGATCGTINISEPYSYINGNAMALDDMDESRADLKYVARYLTFRGLNDVISGSAQPQITRDGLKGLSLLLPPLTEQRRIAAILDKADALRAKRRDAIAKLGQLQQSVFLEMFGDPANNPKRWPTGVIGDMLESAKYGSSEKADLHGDVPIVRMNNLTYTGEMNLTDLKYIASDKAEEKYTVRPGDILFNRTNSKELVGKTAVYEGPTPMAYAGYLVRARTLPEHAPEYISAFLNSLWGKSTLRAMCKNIVGMANINAREFQGIEIPIPPSELQFEFMERVTSIRAQKKKLEEHLLTMDRLFCSLQHQSFAGTL